MVCEKDASCPIDMATEGLDVTHDGHSVFAKGTTLGGDDGIAVAYALALLDDTSIRLFNHVNLGVAVDTPRGLMVPTIFHADEMSLLEISKATKELAAQCREGNISPDLLQGGSFTVSNLGNLGIESFTPVINPPQTGILGVDTTIDRVRRAPDGSIEIYPAMGLSLTYDHRAVDGAPASRFLKELGENLANFTVMLAK